MAKNGNQSICLHPLVVKAHIEETTRRATRRTRRHHFTALDAAALVSGAILLILAFVL